VHTLRLNESDGVWEVGHYDAGSRQWQTFEEFPEQEVKRAIRLVNYLNGGPGIWLEDH
jgi:hypothetical protein